MLKIDRRKLELAMAKKCYTITDLVKKSKVCYSSIVKLAGDRMQLTPRTLGKLAKALSTDPQNLVQDEPPAKK